MIKKTCKCIKNIAGSSFEINSLYYYIISNSNYEIDKLYPYHIYLKNNDNVCLATFSKNYFNFHFIDIKKDRKQKIIKLNENR